MNKLLSSIIELFAFLLPAIMFSLTENVHVLYGILLCYWMMHIIGLNSQWKKYKMNNHMNCSL